MPVTWGANPTPPQTTNGFDIEQYCRFFESQGLSVVLTRNAGLWAAQVLANNKAIAESPECQMLFDALNHCYLIVRGFATDSVRPRQV